MLELGGTALKGWELKAAAPVAFLGRDLSGSLVLACARGLRQDVVWANARYDVAGERAERPGTRRLS